MSALLLTLALLAGWTTLDGEKAQLRDLRGKPVVLNFWATWCGPCQDEMPLLAQAAKEYGPRGVVFVGVSLDEKKSRATIPAFLAQHGITFPVWLGGTAGDLARLKLGEAVPATAFIDAEGRIIARVSGEIRASELHERLEWLVGNRTGPAPAPQVIHLGK